MTWELLWKILFIAVMSLFVLMAVITTIGGAKDIKRLLIHLRQSEEEEEPQGNANDPDPDSDSDSD